MNPHGVIYAGLAGGILGLAVSVSNYFDGQLTFCLPSSTGCIEQFVPDWMPLPPGATNVQRVSGAAGWKILGAVGATVCFGATMSLARSLTEQENKQMQFQAIQHELDLRKAGIKAETQLEAYRQVALLEAAEAVSSTFEPYLESDQPLIDGVDSLDPTRKIEPGQNQTSVEPVTNSTDRWTAYREVGASIIKSMVQSEKSILIASGTGTGKTTTEQYFLQQFLSLYPQAELYALINKNDELYGVRSTNKLIFTPEAFETSPKKSDERRVFLTALLKPLFEVYDIYLQRKQLSKTEREQLKATKPVRLILADWYATYTELQARLTSEELQTVLSMPRQIITVGRDSGVGLIVDTQSANLESLGLTSDASIRQSLDIFSQGFISKKGGEEIGELQTIRLVFKNNAICSAEDRAEIGEAYTQLATGIKKGEITTPIIFTSVGSKPRIGIVPKLDNGFSKSAVDWESVIFGLNVQYQQSEFMIQAIENKDLNTSAKQQIKELLLSWFQGKGWVKVGDARSMCKELRKLTKDADEVRALILELVREESAEYDSTQNAFLIP